MAEDAAVDVHDDVAAGRLDLERGDPLGRLRLVQLHAQPLRRLDDPLQRRRAVRGPVRPVHRHRSHLFAADRPAIRRRRPRAPGPR